MLIWKSLYYIPTREVCGLFWTHADDETNVFYYTNANQQVYLFIQKHIFIPYYVPRNILDVLCTTVNKTDTSLLYKNVQYIADRQAMESTNRET